MVPEGLDTHPIRVSDEESDICLVDDRARIPVCASGIDLSSAYNVKTLIMDDTGVVGPRGRNKATARDKAHNADDASHLGDLEGENKHSVAHSLMGSCKHNHSFRLGVPHSCVRGPPHLDKVATDYAPIIEAPQSSRKGNFTVQVCGYPGPYSTL